MSDDRRTRLTVELLLDEELLGLLREHLDFREFLMEAVTVDDVATEALERLLKIWKSTFDVDEVREAVDPLLPAPRSKATKELLRRAGETADG